MLRFLACVFTDEVLAVYKLLPELNQKVGKHLIDLMAEISDKTNLPFTRMTMESLAVVFTPCLIRKESDDILEVLNNSKVRVCPACLPA